MHCELLRRVLSERNELNWQFVGFVVCTVHATQLNWYFSSLQFCRFVHSLDANELNGTALYTPLSLRWKGKVQRSSLSSVGNLFKQRQRRLSLYHRFFDFAAAAAAARRNHRSPTHAVKIVLE